MKVCLWALSGVVLLFAPRVSAESLLLPEIVVISPAVAAEGERIPYAAQKEAVAVNAAEVAAQIPGVELVRRGANASEPVIRGLGAERVKTLAGAHPLHGACPARMDPPAVYISTMSLDAVRVVKGLPSVTLGRGATGGMLLLETDYDRGPQAGTNFTARAEALWNEGRDGFTAGAIAEGGSDDLDACATVTTASLNDYESGGGVTVPANLDEYGASLSLGYRPTEISRLYGHAQFKREEDVDYPSLPMDVERSDSTILTLGYRVAPVEGAIERIELQGGYSYVDHVMNNARKSNRMMMQAETPSEAETSSGRLDTDWRVAEQHLLTLGLDGEQLQRDATRTRIMPATGMTMKDPLWPDVEINAYGAFGEWNWDLDPAWSLRIGGRIDRAESSARRADARLAAMPGTTTTVRDQYVRFNGPAAAETDREETLSSGNAQLEWHGDDAWSAYLGAGRIERYPSASELYFAFSPAPGGYLIGNPSLETEKRHDINAGVRWNSERVHAQLSAFAARVDDYVLETGLQKIDLNADGTPDNLRGFRNVDAELYGSELAVELILPAGFSVPASLAYVRGKNTTDDRDLPEIPPLSGDAALRYESASARAWWIETGLRFAARQDKIDPLFSEDETPSFAVAHLRGGVKLTRSVTLEAGIENLFDEDYHEHLTRETVLATGDLQAGDEVPAPGCYGYLKLAVVF